MAVPIRITSSLLDVLEVLVHALAEGREMHGWAVKKATGLSGATTYKIFDRLEDAGWVSGRWDESNERGKPPRRYYRLTPTGDHAAKSLLIERRPEALRRGPLPGGRPQPGLPASLLTALRRRLAGGAR